MQQNLSPNTPKKSPIVAAVPKIIAIFLLIPVVYLAVMFILIIVLGTFKMAKLNDHAKNLEKELSSLVFVEGQSVNAKGVVDGDVLTAKDDPAQSTLARGSLTVNKPLAIIESEVTTNLSKSGYEREGNHGIPYYTAPEGRSIVFRYIKNNTAIRISYKFNKRHACPEGYVCRHTAESAATDNIYPVSGFGEATVTDLHIDMTDKSSGYRPD